MASCFGPALPAVDCGDGNICPDGMVCRLPDRVCQTPSADARPPDAQPPDAMTPDSAVPALISRGIIARYLINEDTMGTAPMAVRDSTATPFNLPITYDGSLSYVEADGNRGLSWSSEDSVGNAGAAIVGTEVETLDGTTVVTYEIVFAASLSNNASRIFHLGSPNNGGDATVRVSGPGELEIRYLNGVGGTSWPDSITSGQRHVVHIVFDSAERDEGERLRAYVDGVRSVRGNSSAIGENATLHLESNAELIIGNRPSGMREPLGTIFYLAIYNVALDDAEVASNATHLTVEDDS